MSGNVEVGLLNETAPGPLVVLQIVPSVAPEGNPSSFTVPFSVVPAMLERKSSKLAVTPIPDQTVRSTCRNLVTDGFAKTTVPSNLNVTPPGPVSISNKCQADGGALKEKSDSGAPFT